jgi:hypothetical protein
MDSVCSTRFHAHKVAATAREQARVDIPKETPSWWWRVSAAMVPNTAIIITAAQ